MNFKIAGNLFRTDREHPTVKGLRRKPNETRNKSKKGGRMADNTYSYTSCKQASCMVEAFRAPFESRVPTSQRIRRTRRHANFIW